MKGERRENIMENESRRVNERERGESERERRESERAIGDRNRN